jgi:thiamine biosynthesis lipoprotein
MEIVQLAHHAMATRFEFVLHGSKAGRLRAAGEEAFEEIDRLERQLSLYIPDSDIARINARAAKEPVTISPIVFRVLQQAQACHQAMRGAFDMTVAPLIRCWGFMNDTGRMPEPAAVAAARELVGLEHVHLDEAEFTVRFDRPGVMLDLGAIGKGYAIDRVAEYLREMEIENAFIHGGTSSICAMGTPCDADAWRVMIESPLVHMGLAKPCLEETLAFVELHNETLSVSGIWGRCFKSGGKTYGHVFDPRTGEPVPDVLMSTVILPSGTETDALSTALLVLGAPGLEVLRQFRPEARALVVLPRDNRYETFKLGEWRSPGDHPPMPEK